MRAWRGRESINNLYYDQLDPLLKELEDQCLRYCHGDLDGEADPQQDRLVSALDRLAARTYTMIRNWKWLLRSNALAERTEAKLRHATLTAGG